MPIDRQTLEHLISKDTTSTELDLSFKKITSEDVELLVDILETKPYVTALNLYSNQIDFKGAQALASSTNLKTLNLGHNKIGAEGACALAKNKMLTSLSIGHNKIGDKGAIAFSSNKTLISLNLGHNSIGDIGASFLAKNTTLMLLNITNNKIADIGARTFLNNESLVKLNTANNKIGNEVNEKLSQSIKVNEEQLSKRRNQLIRILIVLTHDYTKQSSTSLWAELPKDIKLYIISYFAYSIPFCLVGKTGEQIQQCAYFILNNGALLSSQFQQGNQFRIYERSSKTLSDKFFFHFFKAPDITALDKNKQINSTEVKKLIP